jgi:YidC/Oxa1 family membrane protein insertase
MVGKLHDGRHMSLWTGFQELLGSVLRFFHDATVMVFGDHAWLVAIVLLTVAVRVLLTPLAIKQFRSMQAMQQLRPQMKEIQDRYKTDRSMIRTDPEKYRAQRQKQQEELMALYQEHNVNPASSCLPLLVQAPILYGLFLMLRSEEIVPELATAPFAFGATLQELVRVAGPLAYALLLLMGITMFVQQRQMMARNASAPAAATDDQAAQIQKIMLYVMPVVLIVAGVNFPVGVVVYWATTNVWQVGQQWFIMREVGGATPPA